MTPTFGNSRRAVTGLLILCLLYMTATKTGAADDGQTFSGLQVPRFVSLKTDRVNLRTGPSQNYPIKLVYVRKGLPLEVIAESELWRRVRDMDGDEGWVHGATLDGARYLFVRGDGSGRVVAVRRAPSRDAPIRFLAQPGVIGELDKCQADWCLMAAQGQTGWVHRSLVWGVYAHETIE